MTNRYNSHHHIHRRSPETENPTLRTNVPKWLNKPYIENSTIGKVYLTRDITVPGSEHATWFWDRDDEYQFDFPNEFVVCADDAPNTDYCSVASFDIGVLDLCSANNWSTANWSFVGESTGSTPSEQCYWELDGNDDSLTRDPVSLEGMSDSRLIYSYRLSWLLDSKDTNLVVQVSDNGFNNCSHFEGTGCRIVMEYYNEEDARSQQVLFRTEELDVSDFDNKQNVQVRFVGKTGSSDTVQVYDVHFAGN